MPFVMLNDYYALSMFGKMYSELNEYEKMLYEEYMDDLSHPEYMPMIIDGNVTDYDVSNIGDLVNFRTGLRLSPYDPDDGYFYYHPYVEGANRTVTMHRLVAETFVPNPENKPIVHHINGNIEFNWYKNLEWFTDEEYKNWAIRTGHRIIKTRRKSVYCTENQIRAACRMMENPKANIDRIEKVTGVPVRIINRIRFENGWYHIAHEYDIKVLKRYLGPEHSGVSMQITQMILDGKSDDYIYARLDLTGASKGIPRKRISDRMYFIRRHINCVE